MVLLTHISSSREKPSFQLEPCHTVPVTAQWFGNSKGSPPVRLGTMVPQGRGLLGLWTSLWYCKLVLGEEGMASTGCVFLCVWMCQISGGDHCEVLSRGGSVLAFLVPYWVWGQLVHGRVRAAVLPALVPPSGWSRLRSPPWCSCLGSGSSGKWPPAPAAAGW